MIDPKDGLPIIEVGRWALEKHDRLRKYVEITGPTRRKYVYIDGSEEYRAGATYIELFSGPGRARIRETGAIVDGSPLVACKAARDGSVPYTMMHLSDFDPASSEAAVHRVQAMGQEARFYAGDARETVQKVVMNLHPKGLHFAFLDPYNLGDLSFDIIRGLSSVKRMDILMHLSIQDMQRNVDRYTAEECETFDRFAPGWRNETEINRSLRTVRIAVISHWRNLVSELGFRDVKYMELVKGTRNQRLYWLVFVSRHKKANEFWNKIRNISGQGELGL